MIGKSVITYGVGKGFEGVWPGIAAPLSPDMSEE
jgi:hypothetical protein